VAARIGSLSFGAVRRDLRSILVQDYGHFLDAMCELDALSAGSGTNNDREGTTGRVLQEEVETPGGVDGMTVELCTTACEGAGYSLAGIEYGQECCES
jgi:hypothetical protein